MSRIKHIISIFLIFIQMISMGHIMFHHQMHALIEGEDMCVVFHNHHHSCCSGCNHNNHNSDQTSDNECSHEENCNSDREFISNESSRSNSEDRAIELPQFIVSDITTTLLLTSNITQEYYIDIVEGIPLSPILEYSSLRAPPAVC